MPNDERTIYGLYPAKHRKVIRWKNGGGTASEILCRYSTTRDDYKWRISTAEVEQDGPFSIFPGKMRLLKVVSGGPLQLVFTQNDLSLTSADPAFAFAGDAACYANILGEKVINLNLMHTPDYTVQMQQTRLPAQHPRESTKDLFAFLLSPHDCFAAHDLFDLMQIEPGVYIRLIGAPVILIEINPYSPEG